MLSFTHALLMPVQLLVLIVGALSQKKLQAAAGALNIGCLNLLRAGLYTISRWCWGSEEIFAFCTAKFPVNQYRQWLFLLSFLPSQKLSLQMFKWSFYTYGCASARCWFFIWFNHFCCLSSLLFAASLKTVKSSLNVREALMLYSAGFPLLYS